MATPSISTAPNTGGGSTGYVAKIQALRSSGAAGKHLNRSDRRARTRSSSRRRAISRDKAAG